MIEPSLAMRDDAEVLLTQMSKPQGEPIIRVHVHGVRNQVAEFDGGWARMYVGAIERGDEIKENSVLLTVDGKDAAGKVIDIDIEIALPFSQVDELIAQSEIGPIRLFAVTPL